MADPSALYPQPPAPQSQGLLQGDPLRLIGALNQVQDFQIRQQQAPALAQTPATNLQAIQLQNQDAMRRAAIGHLAGALNEKSTRDDVHNATANVMKLFPGMDAGIANAAADIFLKAPSIKQGIATAQNILIPPDAALVTVNDPKTGKPQTMTRQQAQMLSAASAADSLPGFASGPPVGEAKTLEDSAERASKLQATGATTAQYHADLDNLKQESRVLGVGGPTIEFEKKTNQFLQRVGLPGLGTLTPEQLRSVESFDKIANQVSLNQSQFFHGSDAGLHTVVGANPNSGMSVYGREGVIDMLQGNQDSVDRSRNIWLDARRRGAPASSHDDFINRLTGPLEKDEKGNWIGGMDPRIFQFNRLSFPNQQKFLSQMDPEDVGDFEQKYQAAIDRKWVKPLKKSNAAQ